MSSLNEKLISEFVEATAPKTDDRTHEFTINGTVQAVDNSGIANVLLDGGDATPCQTTVGCSAGDRVIVSFKNREPVVTSNISKPTATLEEVNAKVVNAVNVFATNGTFSGTLSAATGTFSGSLSAASGTFSGNLSAAGGTFNGLLSCNWAWNGRAYQVYAKFGDKNASTPITIYGTGNSLVGKLETNIADGFVQLKQSGSAQGVSDGWMNLYPSGITTSSGARLISASEITNLNNAMLWRGAFTGNLNSTTIAPGFYSLGNSSSYSGTKPSPPPTWCLFIQTAAYNTQVIIDAASNEKYIAIRDYTGNPAAWGSWKKITAS